MTQLHTHTNNVYNFISRQWMSSNEIYYPKIGWNLHVYVDGWLIFMVLRLFNENCVLQLFYIYVHSIEWWLIAGGRWNEFEMWIGLLLLNVQRNINRNHFYLYCRYESIYVSIFIFSSLCFFLASVKFVVGREKKKVQNLHLFRIIFEALHWTFVPITINH